MYDVGPPARLREITLPEDEVVVLDLRRAGFAVGAVNFHAVTPAGVTATRQVSNAARPNGDWSTPAANAALAADTNIEFAESAPLGWTRFEATGGDATLRLAMFGGVVVHSATAGAVSEIAGGLNDIDGIVGDVITFDLRQGFSYHSPADLEFSANNNAAWTVEIADWIAKVTLDAVTAAAQDLVFTATTPDGQTDTNTVSVEVAVAP